MSVDTLQPPQTTPAPHPAGGDGHAHDHPQQGAARGGRRVKIGPSLLRLSLGARLLVALGLLAPLWLAVALVVSGMGGE